jgi:hypothetical protein
MKGQIFITGAALAIIILALLKTAVIDTGFEIPSDGIRLENLEREYRHATTLSAKQSTDYINTFSSWLRNQSDEFSAFYAIVMPREGGFNLHIGNYLKSQAAISVQATNAAPQETNFVLSDKSDRSVTFSGSGTAVIVITYATLENSTETLSYMIDNRTLAFYDIGISVADGKLRRKNIFEVRVK